MSLPPGNEIQPMSSAPAGPLGSPVPRLWTPPLRELTPETSYGFDLIDFARDTLATPFDPWQEWLAVHVGELLPDGRPRFRTVLILVARQNGKTTFGRALVLYWMFIERIPLTLNTSTDRSYAKRFWTEICETAADNEWLNCDLGADAQRKTIGEESLKTMFAAELIFAANNGRAGRSTTLHRWLADELREHRTRAAWDSASKAMNAVRTAQAVAITNQGDNEAVVLDSLRAPAVQFIETGAGDPRLGLFEWSAPDGADPEDPAALAAANPNYVHRLDPEALQADARRAKAAGGEELTGFRTEVLCQRVTLMDPAIEPDAWTDGGTDEPVNLAEHRRYVALCVDVALDGSHATLAAAALLDGVVHTEIIEAWDGFGCTKALRAALPDVVRRVKPRALGWMPNGPAASVAAALAAAKGPRRGVWPPHGVELIAITAETASVCMGLAEVVRSGELVHPKDPLQTAHVEAAQKLWQGDRWVFVRRGAGPIDGAYATAGAVHLARTLPAPRSPLVAV